MQRQSKHYLPQLIRTERAFYEEYFLSYDRFMKNDVFLFRCLHAKRQLSSLISRDVSKIRPTLVLVHKSPDLFFLVHLTF